MSKRRLLTAPGNSIAVSSNKFASTRWTLYRAGTLGRRKMNARDPTPSLSRVQEGGLQVSRLALRLPPGTPPPPPK